MQNGDRIASVKFSLDERLPTPVLCGEETELALLLVQVSANIVHGRSLLDSGGGFDRGSRYPGEHAAGRVAHKCLVFPLRGGMDLYRP